MSGTKNGRRYRIGFQVTHIGDEYCKMFLADVMDACCKADVDLVVFGGGSLRNPHSYDYQLNNIYRYINPSTVDALVLITGTLRNYVTDDEFGSFLSEFDGIPIVSISQALPDRPSVFGSNRSGVADAIRHLVEVHGRRRIAFVCGLENNPDAQERFAAYRETLASCGIDFDPDLVCQGDFTSRSGKKAVTTLIDERRASFDAMIGANDNMALSAMQALVERGIRVPADVSVIGFDDIVQSMYASPPLTTLRQPYRALGRKAIELAIESIERPVSSEETEFPCELVKRSSCGCLPTSLAMFDRVVELVGSFPSDVADRGLEGYIGELRKLPRPEDLSEAELIEGATFLHSLFSRVPATAEEKHAFLTSVQEFASRPENDPPRLYFWEQSLAAVAEIRGRLHERDRGLLEGREKARIILREARTAHYNRLHYSLIEETEKIQRIVQFLLLTRELSDLYAVLPQIAEVIDIREFFLVIHDTVKTKRNDALTGVPRGRKLVVAISDGRSAAGLPVSVEGPLLLPEEYDAPLTVHCRIVAPLFALEELYGYVCFAPGAYSMELYNSLILELGSAVKRCALGTKQKWTESKLRAALKKLKETNQKLADLSQRDDLTRLFNRRGFLDIAQQSLKFAQRMKKEALLIFADMDGLKRINDTWGHEAGDNAIVAAAIVLKATFRQVDIVARLGGDEFVILTLDSPSETRDIMIDRLNQNIKTFNECNDNQWDLSMSVGIVSISPSEKRTLSELITVADGLQYQEKLSKRKNRQ
jgi:diguanylate cyclase (GGDEF)-like protein